MATSVLTIEELTGTKRRLDLIGPGAPFKGASWGGQTVLKTQWNAGNPEATQHVISPQEDPSAWEGFWRTTMLIASPAQWTSTENGSPQDIVSAANLDSIFEDLRISANLLRVTWNSSQSGRSIQKVRLGRLQQYVGKFDTLDDIAWNATFEWISRGNPGRALPNTQDDVLAATRSSILAQTAIVSTITGDALVTTDKARLQNATNQFRLGDLESLAQSPLAVMNQFAQVATSFTREMKDIGDLITTIRGVPFQVANRALATATNAVATANQFLDEISRVGPEQLTTRNDAALLAQTLSYYGKSQSQAQLMVQLNQQLAEQARVRRSSLSAVSTPGQASQTNPSDVLALYLPKSGDTFAKISAKFYGTGDLGFELARVNGFSAYAISPPTRVALLIPTRKVINQRIAAGI